MKMLWKRTSVIAALLLGISPIFSLFAFAEANLDKSGELRVKIERIGEERGRPRETGIPRCGKNGIRKDCPRFVQRTNPGSN